MAATITPESANDPSRFPNLETVVGKVTWPTPCTRDYKGANAVEGLTRNDGKSRMDQLPNAVAYDQKSWSTPQARDWKGPSGRSMKGEENDLPNQVKQSAPTGQLNPSWVEWLMGWPIGWTSMEAITELDWRDWSDDPADEDSKQTWATPSANKTTKSGEIVNSDGTAWDGISKPHSKTTGEPIQTALSDQVAMNGGSKQAKIPRVATGIKNRVGRLKAIGNGQVPAVAALAWDILSKGNHASE